MKIYCLLFISLIILSGCSRNIPTIKQRYDLASNIAKKINLKTQIYKTKFFKLFSYEDTSKCQDTMSIYIEGDGFAWETSSIISTNPTPINPMALKLMTQDTSHCKVYIARPCQYVDDTICRDRYWTSHRFSKKIIYSYIELLGNLKKKYKVKTFKLYGYSGGGAIATLTTANRDDIIQLVTIAGNLDTDLWTKKHYLTPLKGSLNPANFTKELVNIKQIHLIGANDTNIDKSIFISYRSKFFDKSNIQSIIYKNFTHNCCWSKKWKKILKDIEAYE